MKARFGLLWLLFVAALAFADPGIGAETRSGGAGSASEVSKQQINKCLACHEGVEASHARGAHANTNCGTCHSRAQEHVTTVDRKEAGVRPGTPGAEACLSCHASGKGHAKDANRMNFVFSEHNRAGVQCSDCHGIHNPKVGKQANVADLKMDNNARLCATCHQDVLARFSMPSRHPLREGAVSCTSCHQPHDGKQATLGGKTEQCTKCHQAVRGPHVFEHPPAAEDCANCHNPHGTPNRRLLEVAQPMMCQQCHSVAGNRHGQAGAVNNTQRITGAVLRDCVSCHGAVHGSSTDQHLRH